MNVFDCYAYMCVSVLFIIREILTAVLQLTMSERENDTWTELNFKRLLIWMKPFKMLDEFIDCKMFGCKNTCSPWIGVENKTERKLTIVFDIHRNLSKTIEQLQLLAVATVNLTNKLFLIAVDAWAMATLSMALCERDARRKWDNRMWPKNSLNQTNLAFVPEFLYLRHFFAVETFY